MSTSLAVDLHKLSRAVNLGIPLLALIFFMLGNLSFYFHFFTVAFLLLSIVNLFYLTVQTRHTILRNFGVLGQARYLIESIGPEMRQYLFASDNEERPFNRTERSEVYRKAKNVDSALSFGTLQNYNADEVKIRHSMYPTDKTDLAPFSVTFGEERGLETAYTITKPMLISAMSYGALGAQAVRALARGAKDAGIPMNTGEGGYPKYHLKEGCDLIFQMGTAKFGVRHDDGSLDDDKLRELASQPQIKMIEIKLSQGAKPGKGGLLPKEKISAEIAELRNVKPGKDVISPPHHVECTDKTSTVAFIRRVQEVSGLPVGIKLCVGCSDEFRELVREMKAQDVFPDYIAVDGGEGGTGAAPKAFMDGMGLPLYPGLNTVNQTLVNEGVRGRMKLLASGKLISPGRQLAAIALGADACYSARGFMLALGCIQALQCGNNTCPVGITTHDPTLAKGLVIDDKARRVTNYVRNCYKEFTELLAATGVQNHRELTIDRLYIPDGSTLAQYLRELRQRDAANVPTAASLAPAMV